MLRQNSIDGLGYLKININIHDHYIYFIKKIIILGWAPTRTLKDVIWGLNSLFTVSFIWLYTLINEKLIKYFFHKQDLLNFDDPLNSDAADQYVKDKKEFQNKVREYISLHARR